MRKNIVLAVVLLSPMAAWAADQFDIKPGLWDFSTTVQMNGLPPIPNFDQMPAEQRARIEAAMKNMGGPRTTTVKSCVTKESVQQAIAKASSNRDNNCSQKLINMSSSKVELHMECAPEKGDMKMTGDVNIDRKDAEHIAGTGAMKSTGGNGRTMDVKWSMTGTFVSSDCGNVKPAGQ